MDSISSYLSFLIDNEYFAVNVNKVLEVLLIPKISKIPNVTQEIKGVTNFRGEIIPVFETRFCFGLPENSTKQFVILVIEIVENNNKSIIGAVVDKVREVFEVPAENILPVPEMSNKKKKNLITGLYKNKNDFILLLDIDKLFI